MQSLVFENYNKFIGSIETVRRMKDDIQGIDKQLDSLEQSMTRVSALGAKLDANFQPRRQ